VPANALSAADLAHLAHGALLGEGAPPCLLLMAEADQEGISLWMPPAEILQEDLLELALGFVAPPSCDAVAMAATARAWRQEGAAFDVVVAHALLRSGRSATYVTDPAGEPLLLDRSPEGLVPDLCRRVLALPTAPAEQETDTYLDRMWLDRLLEAATARPGALGPREVLALHPAEQAESFGRDLTWVHVALATHRFAAVVPWAVLRRRFAASGDDRASQAAAWFDDGSFSRWMLAQLPAEADALAALEDLLAAAVHREVVATLALVAELRVDLQDDDADLLLDEPPEHDGPWPPPDVEPWRC
jgi:hypothetical protein